jgi:hypothetical protein
MALEYFHIFQAKAPQNLPKLGFFGLKVNRLATQIWIRPRNVNKKEKNLLFFTNRETSLTETFF